MPMVFFSVINVALINNFIKNNLFFWILYYLKSVNYDLLFKFII